MTSALPCHDAWHGSDRQPPGLGSPRHRSKSKRLAKRCPTAHCTRALHAGDAVTVFSRTANMWIDAEAVKIIEDDYIRVEYQVGEYLLGKALHVDSQDLAIPAALAQKLAFQGCRKELPIECNGDPAKYYIEMDYIWTLLERRHVVLISGRWLLDRSEAVPFVPLPCHQDLPPEAIVSLEQIQFADAELRKFSYWNKGENDPARKSIVALSHCWLDCHHPDPDGSLLQELALPVKAYLNEIWKVSSLQHFDGAFFLAWCSLTQPYHTRTDDGQYCRMDDPQVTAVQMKSHQEALENMDIWYTHQGTEVWRLTKFFPIQEIPYEERGWPTWEHVVSELLTDGNALLDLGKLDGSHTDEGAAQSGLLDMCIDSRSPPIMPEEFSKLIDQKYFSCGTPDREMIKANYKRNFRHAMQCVKYFRFDCLQWNSHQISLFSKVLHQCCNLQDLDLNGNQIGDVGVGALAKALHQCHNLQTLTLDNNLIWDDGACELAKTLPYLNSLQWFCLAGNHIGNVGASALAETLCHCTKLEFIRLKENRIGDTGACALASALSPCSNLTWLVLGWNWIGNAGAQALAGVLRHCIKLKRLTLGDNQIGTAGVCALAEALCPCTNLGDLQLSGNEIGKAGARQLARTICHCASNLQWLRLNRSLLGNDGARDLSEGLRFCNELSRLELADNQIGNAGACTLAEALCSCANLMNLDLSGNDIGNSGAQKLAKTICHCVRLQWLRLDSNQIGDDGAHWLAKSIHHCSDLQWLSLAANRLGDAAADILAKELCRCTKLQWLSVNGNQIGDAGARAIARHLQLCSNLHLDIHDNAIGDAGYRELRDGFPDCNLDLCSPTDGQCRNSCSH